MRPMHITFDADQQCLWASTNRGTILQLGMDLQVRRSSNPIYNLNNIYVIMVDAQYIYGREITGKLIRWNKRDLSVDCMIDLTAWSDPNHADTPNVSHGLFFYNEHVYVSMPQGFLGKFTLSDLAFVSLSKDRPRALIESVSTDGPSGHFAIDFSGLLYAGDVDGDLLPVARISHGACHQMIYDHRYDRYWITDDYHCGLALFQAAQPKTIERIFLSNDDVEWLSFNSAQTDVLVACFDRYIYHLENAREPKLRRRIGPLKYQVRQVVWANDQTAFALTEAGEIYHVDLLSGKFTQSSTGTNAVWDIKPAGDDTFWCAFEDGYIRQLKIEGFRIEVAQEHNPGLGMIRRIVPDGDAGVFILAVNGTVAKFNAQLDATWSFSTKGLLRDLAVTSDSLIFCSEAGELTCLDPSTGSVRWTQNMDLPLWSLTIDPTGANYLVGHRLCRRQDQNTESTFAPANLLIGDMKTGKLLRNLPVSGNVKKLSWPRPDQLLINGNGTIGVTLLAWPELKPIVHCQDWLLNTCESALIHKSKVYATTYGFQLNTYQDDGTTLESAFPFSDYATSLVAVCDDLLMAGGRGAFIDLFLLRDGLPHLVTSRRF